MSREQLVADAVRHMKQFRDAELWIAAQTYGFVFIGSKAHGSKRMQDILERSVFANVCSMDSRIISHALPAWEDFYDCLIWCRKER